MQLAVFFKLANPFSANAFKNGDGNFVYD